MLKQLYSGKIGNLAGKNYPTPKAVRAALEQKLIMAGGFGKLTSDEFMLALQRSAEYVVELPAGTIEATFTQPGDKLELQVE